MRKWMIAGAALALPLFAMPVQAQAQEMPSRGPEVGEIVPTSVDPDGYLPPEMMPLQAQLPTCLEVHHEPKGTLTDGRVHFTNNCPTDQRAKALIAFGPDSECFIIAPGTTATHTYGGLAPRFDGAVAC